jgi:hypothetical protein
MSAIAGFTKDPDNGLTKLGYPVYDGKGKTLIRWAYHNSSDISLGASVDYDQYCRMLNILKDPFSLESLEAISTLMPADVSGILGQLVAAGSIGTNTRQSQLTER